MIEYIDHLNISITNIGEAIVFFRDKLWFVLENQAEITWPVVDKIVGLTEVRAKVAQLSLWEWAKINLIEYIAPQWTESETISQPNAIGFRHLAFNVTNIEQEKARLEALWIRFLSEIHILESHKKKMVYLEWPDGIILELCENIK